MRYFSKLFKDGCNLWSCLILSLVGKKGQDVILKVHDKKNSANSYEEFVGTEASADFTFNFKIENLKIIPGDYDVAVSSKSISHFKNKVKPIEYWIALEPDSKISKWLQTH